MKEDIHNLDDLYQMLDHLFCSTNSPGVTKDWWDQFYQDKSRNVPFFTNYPDENLVTYFEKHLLHSGKAIDIGCGNGRNSFYLATQGYTLDAIDYSSAAIQWARQNHLAQPKLPIDFRSASIFELDLKSDSYDLVYDSGCLHHLYPHVRLRYIPLLHRILKPGGLLGLNCFAPNHREAGGGSDLTDWDIYRRKSTGGGLAFTKDKLLHLFGDLFELIHFRSMRECAPDEPFYGKEFLWVTLWKKR